MSYKGDSTMEIKVRRKKRHQKYVRRRRLFFATLGLLLVIIFIFCFAKGKASKHANAGATHLKAGNKTVATKVVSKYAQYLVAIDAGHGGSDPGAYGFGLWEKNVSLDICKRLDAILQSRGIKTLMIRNDDSYISYKNRVVIANDKNATLFVCLHLDSGQKASYNGTQTFYYPSADLKSGNLTEKDYAETMESTLIDNLHTNNRGILPDRRLSVLWKAKMPSVLIELGFLSNADDAKRLSSDDFKQKAADALADGIQKSLDKITD